GFADGLGLEEGPQVGSFHVGAQRLGLRALAEHLCHGKTQRQHRNENGDLLVVALDEPVPVFVRHPARPLSGWQLSANARERQGATGFWFTGAEPRGRSPAAAYTTATSRSPTPSTWPCILSPFWMAPTPDGVPEKIRSPAFSSNRVDRKAIWLGTSQIIWL